MLEQIERARRAAGRTAVCDASGQYRYEDLLRLSAMRATDLLGGEVDLAASRVVFLQAPGFDHVATQWAIWRAGGVAVPLAESHPAPELARLLVDARPRYLIADEQHRERVLDAVRIAGADDIEVIDVESIDGAENGEREGPLPRIDTCRAALMVYTSGTTGAPKAVVTTHGNVQAQIATLVASWEWTPDDRVLHVLPLHHIHGIINAMSCALWAGACCEFSPPQPPSVWERLSSGEVTLFMAVPTIYRRMVDAWEQAGEQERKRWSSGARAVRLMISGSAALPVPLLERWEQITGHRLLERYGMTEIGMALGNPLHGERRAGTVGQPFPGVEVRTVDEEGSPLAEGEQGELEVRGPQVFREYWCRPEETRKAFREDGWFRTGDEAALDDGYWRILGRRSVDIIKTGGYKVSAVEIEAWLRQRPEIDDVAVVGVPDEEWGERVCAALVLTGGASLDVGSLRSWCKERMAAYKVPKQTIVVPALPRNAMGKVTKPPLRDLFVSAPS